MLNIVLLLPLTTASLGDEALLELIVSRAPETAVVDAASERAEALASAVTFPDPVAALEYSNAPTTKPLLGAHPMTGLLLKVTQPLPAFGRLSSARDAARANAIAERARLPAMKLALAERARLLMVTHVGAREQAALSDTHLASIARVREAVLARYELGKAAQHDLTRLDVKRALLLERARVERSRAKSAAAELNALAGRASDAPLALAPLKAPAIFARAAVAQHPQVAYEQKLIDAARALRTQEARALWPNVNVWAAYRLRLPSGVDPGDNFFSVGVSMPLPVFSAEGVSARERAADSSARAAEARGQRLERDLEAGARRATTTLERARASLTQFERELVPSARSNLDATLADYQVDRASFSDLFAAELLLIDVERAQLTTKIDAARADVRLRAARGALLEDG